MKLNGNERYIRAFGNHLRELRESKCITQEELSDRCQLALSQIGRLERGVHSPTLSTLLILAKGLEEEPKKLLDFKFK